MYLSTVAEALAVFGHKEAEDQNNITYINWLHMARAGLMALQYYTPGKGWGQAHMQARYGILQVFLRAGEGLVTLRKCTDDKDGKPNIEISLDKTKIHTVGKDAVGDFLMRLQVYKSTGNFEAAKAMYDEFTEPNEEFKALRGTVLDRRSPRKLMVQANTYIDQSGQVNLKTYPATPEGMIQSFQERYN
mmetsp:Transcript_20488/g.24895  ORF Transcript_20488/g.24895 Transcript_20488/m.24895 type:complete len:189 (+) Transcript_20488:551-1117(+)